MCKPYLDPELCTGVTDCRRIPGHHVAEVVVAVLIQSNTEVHTTSTTASNPVAKVVVAIVLQTKVNTALTTATAAIPEHHGISLHPVYPPDHPGITCLP